MTIRQYLMLMMLSTAGCWFGWWSVVQRVDPVFGGPLALVLFYATLSLSFIGTLSIAGVLVRVMVRRHEAAARHVAASFRQSLLLSALAVAALILQGLVRLSAGNLIVLIGLATLCEIFLISANSRQKTTL